MELLKKVKEIKSKKEYSIKEIINNNIAIRLLSKDEVLQYIKERNSHGYNGFDENILNGYILKENIGITTALNNYKNSSFSKGSYWEDNDYKIVLYKDITINWNE